MEDQLTLRREIALKIYEAFLMDCSIKGVEINDYDAIADQAVKAAEALLKRLSLPYEQSSKDEK